MKRCICIISLLPLLVVAGCGKSGPEADFSSAANDLSGQLASAKTDGLPATQDELFVDKFTLEENAATYYEKALALAEKKAVLLAQIMPAVEAVPDSPDWREGIKRMSSISDIFDALDKGASMQHCRFNIDYEKGFAVPTTSLARLRGLGYLLCWRARIQARDGHYADAVNSIVAAAKLGDHIAQEPMLFSYLLDTSLRMVVLRYVEMICSDSKGAPDLISKLKEVEPVLTNRPSFKRALEGDYVLTLAAFKNETLHDILSESGALEPDETVKSFPKMKTETIRDGLEEQCVDAYRTIYKIANNSSLTDADQDSQIYDYCTKPTTDPTRSYAKELITTVYPSVSVQLPRSLTWSQLVTDAITAFSKKSSSGQFPPTLKTHTDPFTAKPLIYEGKGEGFTVRSSGPPSLKGRFSKTAFAFTYPYDGPQNVKLSTGGGTSKRLKG